MKTAARILLTLAIYLTLGLPGLVQADDLPLSFTYQGRLFNAGGTSPLLSTVDLKLEILSPDGACLLYAERQNGIDLNLTNGVFSVQVGSPLADAKRTAATTDPGLAMFNVFANRGAQIRADDSGTTNTCPGGYTPVTNDARVMRVSIIDGATTTVLNPNQLIQTVPYATVAETLQGIAPSGLIKVTATVTQANLTTLTDGSDASALHKHDSLYAKLGATSSQNLGSGGIYTTGAIGVGTSTPATQIEIEAANPALRIDATAGNSQIQFYSGATERARIQSSATTNQLLFYTGGSLALTLDPNQNAAFAGNLTSAGFFSMGQYTNATEGTLVTTYLTPCGTACRGTIWTNSDLGSLRYWNGAWAETVPSVTNFVAGGVVYSTAGRITVTAAGTAGQVLVSGGAGAPTWGSASDSTKLPLAGGTMTGSIDMGGFTISNMADPTAAQHAATKAYVDATVNTAGGSYVAKAGDTMTGALTLPTNGLVAGTTQLVLSGGNVGVGTATPTAGKFQVNSATTTTVGAVLRSTDDNNTKNIFEVHTNAGVVKASIRPDGVPTAATDLTTKSYVDTAISSGGGGSGFVSKTGDTMAGALTITAGANQNAFYITGGNNTAIYVDNNAVSGTGFSMLTGNPGVGRGVNISRNNANTGMGSLLEIAENNSGADNIVALITNAGTGKTLLVEDVASDTTPFVIDNAGNMGVGIASPTSKIHGDTALSTATGNQVAYQLNYTTNKATSGNDTGLLISMTDTASPGTSLPLDIQVGGVSKFSVDNTGKVTGDGSGLTGITATSYTGVLPIANGGTNNGSLTVANGGIIFTDGTKMMNSLAGTSGQVLTSAGAGAPTWTTATNANTASAIVQRDSNGHFAAGILTTTGVTITGGTLNVSSATTTTNGAIFKSTDDNNTKNIFEVQNNAGTVKASIRPDGVPTATTDLTTKAYVDTAISSGGGGSGFVAKVGDAMTGTLTLPTNGLVAGTNQLVLSSGYVGVGTASPVDVFSIGTAPTASATRALVNLTNTALSGGSASGTYLGANPAAAGADLIHYQVNGTQKFKVDQDGNVHLSNGKALWSDGSLTYLDATTTNGINFNLGAGGTVMKIANTGNLGVGTTSPASKIHGVTSLSAATGNEVAYTLDYTTNKATSGNDTGLLISMTDTASPGTSLPLDIQVGGVSKFSVDATGKVTGDGSGLTGIAATSYTGVLPIANGGTNNGSLTVSNGGIIFTDGTKMMNSLAGTSGQVLTSAGAGAPTWTTATSANTASAIVQRDASGYFAAGIVSAAGVTIAGGTVTASTPFVDATQTWNAGGTTFTAIKADVTDTASAATSLLMDLQVGGVSKFSVDKTGKLVGDGSGLTGIAATSYTGVLPIANGGTNNGSLTVANGGIIFTDGTKFMNSLAGTSGQVLTSAGAGAPTWTAAASANTASSIVQRDATGNFYAGYVTATGVTVTGGGSLYAEGTTATKNVAILKSTDDDNTKNIFEVRNNAGTVKASVRPDGVPTATTDLTTKAYVDTAISSGGGGSGFVSKTGDTINGALTITAGASQNAVNITGGNNNAIIVENGAVSGTAFAMFTGNPGIGQGIYLNRNNANTGMGPLLGIYEENVGADNTVAYITNKGTGKTLLVEDVNSDTTPFVIDNAGNVGVGTASPTSKLHGVTGLSGATGNEVAYSLDYTTNKATSGNDTGLLISMTDTASPGTSLPLDIQVGGVSKFSVDATGKVTGDGSGLTGITATSYTGVLPIANGGTNNGSLTVANGGMLYTDGTKVMNSLAGTSGQVLTSAGAAAPTWTTAASANTAGAIVQRDATGNFYAGYVTATGVTITGGTVTASTPFVDATQTWNAGGTTFTGIKANVTDTASSATSLLMDLQVGGVSKFSVDKTGKLVGDGSGLTGITATSYTGVLPIANGGTNNGSLTVANGGIIFTDGTKMMNSLAGTSGQVLTSAGAGAPTWTTAASANTASAIVQRDATGNFYAGYVTATGVTVTGGGSIYAENTTATKNVAVFKSTDDDNTKNIFEVQNNAGAVKASIRPDGVPTATTDLTTKAYVDTAISSGGGGSGFVAKVGDTMTGALTLPTNGLVAGTTQLVLSGGNVGVGTASPTSKIHGVASMAAATGNEIAYTLGYTTNKATSGNDTGLLIAMTDTASPGTSLPLDIQVGGVSKFSVDATGKVTGDGSGLTGITATSYTGVLPIANGGTNNGSLTVSNGGIIFTDGTKMMNSLAGTSGQVLTSAGAAAPTWTTAASANTASAIVQRDASGYFAAGIISTSGVIIAGGTVTASTPFVDATQTWNAGGTTFTAIKADVTDTASAATSLLMDLQVGGVSKFSVDKTGKLVGDGSGLTGITATSYTGVLPIANGGTNNGSLTVSNGGIIFTDGTKMMNSLAGTSGQVLTSAGAGAPTWTTAASANTASAIVQRDGTGNFYAGYVTATGVTVTGGGSIYAENTTATKNVAILKSTDDDNTKNIFEVRNNAGTVKASVRPDGVPTATTDLTTKSYVDTAISTAGSGSFLPLGGGTMTGAILGAAGAVGAPSYSFSGDTNTGIYSGTADVIRFATGGVERASIDASGVFKVGTSASSPQLNGAGVFSQQGVLNNSSASNWWVFKNNEGAWIDEGNYAQNYVFVAPTYAPSASTIQTKVRVVQSDPTFNPSDTAPTISTGQWVSMSAKGTFGSGDELYDSSSPMIGLEVIPTINVGTGSTGKYTALLVNPTQTSVGTGVTNYIADFQVGGASKMAITAGGNVGIGNTSPGAKLEIGTAGTSLGTMRLAGNTSGYVQIQPAAAAGSWTMTLPDSAGTNGYVLQTNGSGVTSWVAQSAGGVTSVYGRTGAVTAAVNDYTWAQIDKTTSSLADLTTRSAGDLSSGTLDDARLSSNVPLKNAANIFTAANTITVATTSSNALVVKSSDDNNTKNILEVQNNAGTVKASVRPDGVPTATTDLTTKAYVDTAISSGGGGSGFVAKVGDAMTGTLTLASNGLVAGTNQLVISSGNVGIGTASPTSKIHGVASLAAATGNEIAYTLDYTTNKATSGNDTGLLIKMTDTASPGTSLPLDIQVGGVSKFSVDQAGNVTTAGTWSGTISGYMKTDGSTAFTGSVSFGGNDAVNMANLYVDSIYGIGGTNGAALNLAGNSFSSANKIAAYIGSGTHSQTSGTNGALVINPTYNQTSGTAANTDLLINRTETAVGSGSQRLFDAQVGGTSKFTILSSGNVGIGTSGPTAKLEIESATTTTNALILKSTDDNNTKNIFEVRNNAGTVKASVRPDGVTTAATDLATKSYVDTAVAAGGSVSSVFGRTGAITSAVNDYTWAQIDKTTSSLANLTTRSAGDLSSGTLDDARLSSNVPLKNAANIFTGANTITVATTSSNALVLKSSDDNNTKNIWEVQNNAGTVKASVRPDGVATATTDLTTKSYVDTAVSTAGGSYIAKAGDTMTGTLTLASNGLVAGTTQLVLSSGNVGIGTASPTSKLHGVASLAAATGNEIAYTLAYTTNKATSGNDTGLLISMTDTASPGTSLPLDIKVGGSTVFSVDNTGKITGDGSSLSGVVASGATNIDITISGGGGTTGKPVYISANNTTADADNSAIGTARVVCIKTGATTCRIAGIVTGILAGATAGTPYYLSTSGAYTTTPPTTSGTVVLKVGIALNATDLLVQISDPIVN